MAVDPISSGFDTFAAANFPPRVAISKKWGERGDEGKHPSLYFPPYRWAKVNTFDSLNMILSLAKKTQGTSGFRLSKKASDSGWRMNDKRESNFTSPTTNIFRHVFLKRGHFKRERMVFQPRILPYKTCKYPNKNECFKAEVIPRTALESTTPCGLWVRNP